MLQQLSNKSSSEQEATLDTLSNKKKKTEKPPLFQFKLACRILDGSSTWWTRWMTPCEVSFLSFLFPMLVYVSTTALYFFGFNLPPWNHRKVIWWRVTWASIDNNASTEMGETSQKAECFVCHTELFFLFKLVKPNNRNTLVFRLNVTLFTELWAIYFHCFRLSLNMSLTFANNKNVCIV